MAKIYNNIEELIGNTPLVRINKMNGGGAEVLVKVESFNPASCVKERIALAMIDAAEPSVLLGRRTGVLIYQRARNGEHLLIKAGGRRQPILAGAYLAD